VWYSVSNGIKIQLKDSKTMITQKTFLVDDKVHNRLKQLAKENGLTTGGMVRRLVENFEGKPNYRTREYKLWLQGVLRIERLWGEPAALQFMAENPPPR
jgi:hypothetical protein